MKISRTKFFILSITLLAMVGCTSRTVIRTQDPEVRIYVDEQLRGTGQAKYDDMKISGSKVAVVLKKTGCREQIQMIKRSERVDYWAVGFGWLLVPLLWVLQYDEEREFGYECLPE